MGEYKRLVINVAPEVYDELTRLADERGIAVTELIKRAVALDKYCWEHRDAELLVKDGDNVHEIVMF